MKNAARNTMGRCLLAAALCGGTLIGCAPQDDGQATPEQLKRRCAVPQKTMAEIDAAEWEVFGTAPSDGEEDIASSYLKLPADEVRGPFAIKVHFLVITSGTAGNVTDQQIADQMKVMNDGFAGTLGGADMKISFTLESVERINKPAWYGMGYGSQAERDAKSYMRTKFPNPNELIVYTANLGGGLLGWATFPSDFQSAPLMDGVVILNASLPGGTAAPYNEGDTLTHEVGHWVGLYHTFQEGCSAPGDLVKDTPRVAEPNFGNPEMGSVDSCDYGDGVVRVDLIDNYMDYVDDVAMFKFTPKQALRALRYVDNYRFL